MQRVIIKPIKIDKVTTDHMTYTPTQFEIITAVSIIYNTAPDIIIKGFYPRTKGLP
jgi:hypothetical protein